MSDLALQWGQRNFDFGGFVLHATILSEGLDSHTHHDRRAFGRFYTPEVIAEQLALRTVGALDLRTLSKNGISCIDPFCGDGRLITALMVAALGREPSLRKWRVTLWDMDAAATQVAGANVSAVASRLGLDAEIRSLSVDAFMELDGHVGEFDAVVTNPPWEALKPDRRETDHMSAERKQSYVDALRAYDDLLAEVLPLSQPSRKFSGWGTNLSRCGLELSMQLCRRGAGVCAIVLPASILGDQTTRRLRAALFRQFRVSHVAHFPAEARLFTDVDQPFVTLVASEGGPTTSTTLERHGRDGRVCDSSEVEIAPSEMEALGFRLPCEIPGDLLSTFVHFGGFASVGSLESTAHDGLWMGRELDETGYTSYTASEGSVPFIKGRMVERYRTPADYTLYLRDENRRLPESTGHPRVAWRDVSRRSQRRRVQATLLPDGPATGNSLHVAYFRDDDESRLLALLAILNSLPVELQVRSGLGTGHVSLGAVREVRIPALDNQAVIQELAALARRALAGDAEADSRIDTVVARLYGIDGDTMLRIQQFCYDPYSDCSR